MRPDLTETGHYLVYQDYQEVSTVGKKRTIQINDLAEDTAASLSEHEIRDITGGLDLEAKAPVTLNLGGNSSGGRGPRFGGTYYVSPTTHHIKP